MNWQKNRAQELLQNLTRPICRISTEEGKPETDCLLRDGPIRRNFRWKNEPTSSPTSIAVGRFVARLFPENETLPKDRFARKIHSLGLEYANAEDIYLAQTS
jgi:hypothetical protein